MPDIDLFETVSLLLDVYLSKIFVIQVIFVQEYAYFNSTRRRFKQSLDNVDIAQICHEH